MVLKLTKNWHTFAKSSKICIFPLQWKFDAREVNIFDLWSSGKLLVANLQDLNYPFSLVIVATTVDPCL